MPVIVTMDSIVREVSPISSTARDRSASEYLRGLPFFLVSGFDAMK
jgi:hypothetical protein